MRRSWRLWAAPFCLAALAIAGCGSSKPAVPAPPKAPVLVKEVITAMRNADSVHLSGSVKQNGKAIGINLSMTRSGGMFGRVARSGVSFTVLSTQGVSYIKLNKTFLRLAHLPASAVGKYWKLTNAQSHSMFGDMNMNGLMASMTKTPPPSVRSVGRGTVNGQPAWVLRDRDGGVAYVAARGKPYLLRLVAPRGSSGTINFSQWNAVTIPGPPPTGQVVDFGQLVHMR